MLTWIYRTKLTRVLIFNCTSGRSGHSFLATMHAKLIFQLKSYGKQEDVDSFFDHVIFCTNVTYADGHFKGGMCFIQLRMHGHIYNTTMLFIDLAAISIPPADLAELKTQQQLASAWSSLISEFPSSHIHVLPSIEHAVREVRAISPNAGGPIQVLVTGSLHLVGGLIEVADLSDLAL